MSSAPEKSFQVLSTNRKARHDFSVLDRFEAGIALQGTEVKSIRAGQINLTGGFALVTDTEIWLQDVHIAPYEFGNQFNHDPTRPRRLLLHRQEIRRLAGQVAQKGFTLIPLRCYLKRGRVKIEIGLCRGKQDPDKRETLRRREADREASRSMRGTR